jgi:hypothetical protein
MNPAKGARSPVVGDHGGPGYLHGLCIWITGYSPKSSDSRPTISENFFLFESVICSRCKQGDFGQTTLGELTRVTLAIFQ